MTSSPVSGPQNTSNESWAQQQAAEQAAILGQMKDIYVQEDNTIEGDIEENITGVDEVGYADLNQPTSTTSTATSSSSGTEQVNAVPGQDYFNESPAQSSTQIPGTNSFEVDVAGGASTATKLRALRSINQSTFLQGG